MGRVYRDVQQARPPPEPGSLFPVTAGTSTVWMVHAMTAMSGVKGELGIDDRGVTFAPRQVVPGAETVFPFDDIRRVRRLRGSPILELHLRRAEKPKVVAFYFVQPPSLEAQEDSRLRARRRLRREAAVSLFRLNPVKKPEIAGWVETIRAAKDERSG
jgi:hypothetical protein